VIINSNYCEFISDFGRRAIGSRHTRTFFVYFKFKIRLRTLFCH